MHFFAEKQEKADWWSILMQGRSVGEWRQQSAELCRMMILQNPQANKCIVVTECGARSEFPKPQHATHFLEKTSKIHLLHEKNGEANERPLPHHCFGFW